ncbi:hypothetical protein K504DRAFT_131945 [Pleomassaria siparia CBS 279.74]|uniref:Uncharacterized protein n=1 Tax=Pleomassaria siparia CBS 279.74 TaxID=1314801 RepID=A0A6G1KKZ6_9PLEO|nr:hypothetical protein K504DRAFT_131945 [Pleomassaria siparia CBS 279.74]
MRRLLCSALYLRPRLDQLTASHFEYAGGHTHAVKSTKNASVNVAAEHEDPIYGSLPGAESERIYHVCPSAYA